MRETHENQELRIGNRIHAHEKMSFGAVFSYDDAAAQTPGWETGAERSILNASTEQLISAKTIDSVQTWE